MGPKKVSKPKPVAQALPAPPAPASTRSVVTHKQARSPDGMTVSCTLYEARCTQDKRTFSWSVKDLATGATVPLRPDDTCLDGGNERGFAAFVSDVVLLLFQDYFVTLYSLPNGTVLLSQHVGYQSGPVLIGTYLLMTRDDGGCDDGDELTVYDLSSVAPGAPKAALKCLKTVAWTRQESPRKGIAGRLRKKARGEAQAEADDSSASGGDDDDDGGDGCEALIREPRRAYPNWGVELLGDGWLATLPAGDEAPNRYGQQCINLYCLKEQPRRMCDIPSLQGDVAAIHKRGDALCVEYQNHLPDFWNLRKRRQIKNLTQADVAPFCTPNCLGRFYSASEHMLLVAAAAGDAQAVQRLVETEKVDVNARGVDLAICNGYRKATNSNNTDDDDTELENSCDDVVGSDTDGRKARRNTMRRARGNRSLGPTALSLAVERSDPVMVKYLLSRGASPGLCYSQPYAEATVTLLAMAEKLPPSTSKQLIVRRIKRALGSADEALESEDDMAAVEVACKPTVDREKALRNLFQALQQDRPPKKGMKIDKIVAAAKAAGVNLMTDTLKEFGDAPPFVFAASNSTPVGISAAVAIIEELYPDDETSRLRVILTPLPNLGLAPLELCPALKKFLPPLVVQFHEAALRMDLNKMRDMAKRFVESNSPADAQRLLLNASIGNYRRPVHMACSARNVEFLHFLLRDLGQHLLFEDNAYGRAENFILMAVRSFFAVPDTVALLLSEGEKQLQQVPVERRAACAKALRHAFFLAAIYNNNTRAAEDEWARWAAAGEPLDPDYSCLYGSPLAMAVSQANCVDLVKCLLQQGASPVVRYPGQPDHSILSLIRKNQIRPQPECRDQLVAILESCRSAEDELGDAVQKGDVEACRRLLAQGVNVNSPLLDALGAFPLHVALGIELRHQLKLLPMLLAAGADTALRFRDETVLQKVPLATSPDVFLLLSPGHVLQRLGALFAAIRRADPAAAQAALAHLSADDIHSELVVHEKSAAPWMATQQAPTSAFSFAVYIFLNAHQRVVIRDEEKANDGDGTALAADALRVLAQLVDKSPMVDKYPPMSASSNLGLIHVMLWRVLGRDINQKALLQQTSGHKLLPADQPLFTLRSDSPREAAESAILELEGFSCFCRRDSAGLLRLHALPREQFPGLDKLCDAYGTPYLRVIVNSFGADCAEPLIDASIWPAAEWVATFEQSGQTSLAFWALVYTKCAPGKYNPADIELLCAAAKGLTDVVKKCVEQDGADVNFHQGPKSQQTPLLASLADKSTALYLLSRGADPLWKNDDGMSAVSTVAASLEYSFNDVADLVEIYLAMTKLLDSDQTQRLIVNLRIRQPLWLAFPTDQPDSYYALFSSPLLVAEGWAEVLRLCGVKETRTKQLLTKVCRAQGPLVEHALWCHPRVLHNILSIPGVTPSKTFIKQAKTMGKDTTLLEAADQAARDAALRRLVDAMDAKKAPGLTPTF